MVAVFCLRPSDNVPPKTPIPIQPSARHSSSKSSLLLLFGLIPDVPCLLDDLCALHPDHNMIRPWQTLTMYKTSYLHWRQRLSQQVFQSPLKPNSAIAPLILYLECSDFHSMLKSVPFLFLLELSFVSTALPSVVFLGMSLPHSHFIFFSPSNNNCEILCLLICMTSISPVIINSDFCQMTLLLIHWMLLVRPSSSRNYLPHFPEQQSYLWNMTRLFIFCSHLGHIFHHLVHD